MTRVYSRRLSCDFPRKRKGARNFGCGLGKKLGETLAKTRISQIVGLSPFLDLGAFPVCKWPRLWQIYVIVFRPADLDLI